LELPNEEYLYELKKVKAADVDDSIKYLADLFSYYQSRNYSKDDWNKKVRVSGMMSSTSVHNYFSF
jgi:hypothetical protein